jgi:hypothetical protein
VFHTEHPDEIGHADLTELRSRPAPQRGCRAQHNTDGLSARRRSRWGRHCVRSGQNLPRCPRPGSRRRRACVSGFRLASQYCTLASNESNLSTASSGQYCSSKSLIENIANFRAAISFSAIARPASRSPHRARRRIAGRRCGGGWCDRLLRGKPRARHVDQARVLRT